MIHSGGIIGAGLPMLQSITFPKVNCHNIAKKINLRTDREKRDFVSGNGLKNFFIGFPHQ